MSPNDDLSRNRVCAAHSGLVADVKYIRRTLSVVLVKLDALGTRPTWFSATLITILSGAVIGLLVALAKNGGG